MRTLLAIAATLFSLVAAAPDAWPAEVNVVKLERGKSLRVQDLSMVSCLPVSQKAMFRGNTVLFATKLPAHATLSLHAMPKDPARKISVFAYAIAGDRYDVPASRASPLACKWATRAGGPETSKLKLDGGDKDENVVVGVSGPGEVLDAPFTLELELR